MTVRVGRLMRWMFETVLDVLSRPDGFRSKELDLFAHKHRKVFKEMRKARELQRKPCGTPSQLTTLLNDPRGEPLDMTRSPHVEGEP